MAASVVGYVLIVQAAYRWNPGDPYSLRTYHVLAAVFAVLPVVILIHEAGHALAGAMVGFRSFRIAVGAGPRLFAFDVGQTRVEINALLTGGGFTEMGTTLPGAIHLRNAIATLGGPLAPVLVALVVLGIPTSSTAGEVLRASFVGVALLTSALSLIPQTVNGIWSDGRQLLASMRPDPVHTRLLLAAHDQLALRDALEGSDTEGVAAMGSSSSAVVASAARVTLGDFDGAIDSARDGLASASVDETPVLQNNLAYALARRGRPEDIEEALSVIE
jgi:membrane-associated protease RseP (regulator of RpoE activity)